MANAFSRHSGLHKALCDLCLCCVLWLALLVGTVDGTDSVSLTGMVKVPCGQFC